MPFGILLEGTMELPLSSLVFHFCCKNVDSWVGDLGACPTHNKKHFENFHQAFKLINNSDNLYKFL